MSSNKKQKRTRSDSVVLLQYAGRLPESVEKNADLCDEYRWVCGSLREYYNGVSGFKIVLETAKAEISVSGTTLKMLVVFRNDDNFATEIFDLGKIVKALDPNYSCYLSTTKELLTIECQRAIVAE